jgi:hypothetical protein
LFRKDELALSDGWIGLRCAPRGTDHEAESDTGSTDAVAEHMLRAYDTITVVGTSDAPAKPAHYVPLHMRKHGWRVIPVNPNSEQMLGERAYPTLADVPEQVGLVDVFRPSLATPACSASRIAT